jgi:hypothetical protein
VTGGTKQVKPWPGNGSNNHSNKKYQLSKPSPKTMESFSVCAILKGQKFDNNSITLDPSIQELVVEIRSTFLIPTVCTCTMQFLPYEKL